MSKEIKEYLFLLSMMFLTMVLFYQLNKHPWFTDIVELFAHTKGFKII